MKRLRERERGAWTKVTHVLNSPHTHTIGHDYVRTRAIGGTKSKVSGTTTIVCNR